jgi:hypothetical protein
VEQTPEQLKNEAIDDLACQTGAPTAYVRKVYEEEFARLAVIARIPDYLVLLAMKRTRERLARRSRSDEVLVD